MLKVNRFHSGRQRGAVLIVALVLLLVLTVLGTASVRDTTMEERMAGNFRDHSTALEAAETALRAGEVELGNSTAFGNMTFSASGGSSGHYDVEVLTNSVDPKSTWSSWSTVDTTVLLKTTTLVSSDPDFYIEQLPKIELPASDLTVGFQDQAPQVQFYRVSGKGFGVSPDSEVILQSTYFR